MSLLSEIQEHYEGDSAPPLWVDGIDQVQETSLGSMRWGTHKRWVFSNEGQTEFVAVEDVEPATEMQSWGDYGDPKIYPVEQYTEVVTVVKYRKIES